MLALLRFYLIFGKICKAFCCPHKADNMLCRVPAATTGHARGAVRWQDTLRLHTPSLCVCSYFTRKIEIRVGSCHPHLHKIQKETQQLPRENGVFLGWDYKAHTMNFYLRNCHVLWWGSEAFLRGSFAHFSHLTFLIFLRLGREGKIPCLKLLTLKNPTTFLSNIITDRFQLESCCFYFNFIKGVNKGYPRHHNKITLTVKLHY